MAEGYKPHLHGLVSRMRRADDDMAQLRAPSLQEGELLETLSVLPPRRLLRPTLL
jgi:hypothetical protein